MGCGIDLSDLLVRGRPRPEAAAPPAPPKQEIHYHYEGDRSVTISDSVVSRSTIGAGEPALATSGQEAAQRWRVAGANLSACPHCGARLELPMPPRYCPYCAARLTPSPKP